MHLNLFYPQIFALFLFPILSADSTKLDALRVSCTHVSHMPLALRALVSYMLLRLT